MWIKSLKKKKSKHTEDYPMGQTAAMKRKNFSKAESGL